MGDRKLIFCGFKGLLPVDVADDAQIVGVCRWIYCQGVLSGVQVRVRDDGNRDNRTRHFQTVHSADPGEVHWSEQGCVAVQEQGFVGGRARVEGLLQVC